MSLFHCTLQYLVYRSSDLALEWLERLDLVGGKLICLVRAKDDAGALRMLYGGALLERNTFGSNVASGGDGG